MNALALNQQDVLRAIDAPAVNGAPSARALRELFLDLWTRCAEASFRASVIATYPSVKADPNALKVARNIHDICDVDAIYRRMHAALNEMQTQENREVDQLRERCALLAAENARLRAKAGTA